MIVPERAVADYLSAIAGYRHANESDFNVKLARYAIALEKENAKLRAAAAGEEFDHATRGGAH
ncbi:MAG: hypothetical protein ABJA80_04095 [bacterium]